MSLPTDAPPQQAPQQDQQRANIMAELEQQRALRQKYQERASKSRSRIDANRVDTAENRIQYLTSKLEHLDDPLLYTPSENKFVRAQQEILAFELTEAKRFLAGTKSRLERARQDEDTDLSDIREYEEKIDRYTTEIETLQSKLERQETLDIPVSFDRERVYNYTGSSHNLKDSEVRQARNDYEVSLRNYRRAAGGSQAERLQERDPYQYELELEYARNRLRLAEEWYDFVRDTKLPSQNWSGTARGEIKAAKAADLKPRYGEQSTFQEDVFEQVKAEEKAERAEERAQERAAVFAHYRALDEKTDISKATFTVDTVKDASGKEQVITKLKTANGDAAQQFINEQAVADKLMGNDQDAKDTGKQLTGETVYENPQHNIQFGSKKIGDIITEEIAKGEKGMYRSRTTYDPESVDKFIKDYSKYQYEKHGKAAFDIEKVAKTQPTKTQDARKIESELVKTVPKPTGNIIIDAAKGVEAPAKNIADALVSTGVILGKIPAMLNPATYSQARYEVDYEVARLQEKTRPEIEGDLISLGISKATGQDVSQTDLAKIGQNVMANPAYAAGNIVFSGLTWLLPVGKAASLSRGLARGAVKGARKVIPEVERRVAQIALQGDPRAATRAAIEAARPETSIFRYYPNYGKLPELKDISRTFERAKPTKAGIIDVDEVTLTKEFERAPTGRFLQERRPEVLGQKPAMTIDEELDIVKINPSKPAKLPTLADIAKSEVIEPVKSTGAPVKGETTLPYQYKEPTLGEIMKPDIWKAPKTEGAPIKLPSDADLPTLGKIMKSPEELWGTQEGARLGAAARAEASVSQAVTPSGKKIKKLSDIMPPPEKLWGTEQNARLAQSARAEASAAKPLDDVLKRIDAESKRLRKKADQPKYKEPEPASRSGLTLVQEEKDVAKAIMNVGKKQKPKPRKVKSGESGSPYGTGVGAATAAGRASDSDAGYTYVQYPSSAAKPASIEAYNQDMINRVDNLSKSVLTGMTSITAKGQRPFVLSRADTMLIFDIGTRVDAKIKSAMKQTQAQTQKQATGSPSVPSTKFIPSSAFTPFQTTMQTPIETPTRTPPTKPRLFVYEDFFYGKKKKKNENEDFEYGERFWNLAPVETLLFGGKKAKKFEPFGIDFEF